MCLLLCLAATALAPLPLPRQTLEQVQIVKRATTQAAEAAARGATELLVLLNDSATKRALRDLDDGSHLHELPASKLLGMMVEELDAAELVHNFGDVGGTGNCGQDVDLSTGERQPYFYNQ